MHSQSMSINLIANQTHLKFRAAKFLNLCLLVITGTWNAISAPENVEKNADGLLIHLGQAQVQLAPVNTSALRLSVALDGQPKAAPSVFLADTNSNGSMAWQEIKADGMVGIRTAAGELLMNPINGQWALKNAEGKVLIPRHAIGNFISPTESSSISLTLGWKKHQPLYVYGCGNGVNALQQSHATTGVGNGVAVIPYYWSDAGYAVLAVTTNDNRPAHWLGAANGKSVTWIFAGTTADLYLMPAATLKDAAKGYAQLTGRTPVPPRWTFGYLQSRWGWANRDYIEYTLAQFLKYKIPVDAFIYDFEWYTVKPDYALSPRGASGFSDFGWNTNLFPNAAEQIKNYQAQGVHFVGIRKPRMGNANTLAMIRQKHWDLPHDTGKEKFQSRDLNFANPELRDWYASQMTGLLEAGIDGWWDDEGEATFTTYYYWNLAEKEALADYKPDMRLWTLNRAFSPGLQRLGAAAWTGDIRSSWTVLSNTPTSLLNWSLAGLPYETCDIGGFVGNPSPEMLSRWMEAGAFFPVMRSHSEFEETPRFPWLYGPDALKAIRKAIQLRYRLIPYYYSVAHETFESGVPLMRPLLMEFPDDPKVTNLSDEWLMGSSLLAAPVLQPGGGRTVYLPDDRWYAFESNVPLKGKQTIKVNAGLDEIPLYVRSGTILPLGPAIQHTSQLPGGPLELEIYPGKDAAFTLVQDDGETTGYLKGQVLSTIFRWNDKAGQLSWTTEGNYSGNDVFKNLHVIIFDPHGKLEANSMLTPTGSLTVHSMNQMALPTAKTVHADTLQWVVANSGVMKFEYYLPKGYDARDSKRWPLMLFLHGAGERGDDVGQVAKHGPLKLINEGQDLPFIIVAPQCPSGQLWKSDSLLQLLDHVTKTFKVDQSRVYLVGLSMGGYAAWNLGLCYPEKFAAVVPISGGGDLLDIILVNPEHANALKTLPVWAFHGAKDPVVPLNESQRTVDFLRAYGDHEVKLTIYPEAKHDAWTQTFDNPEVFTWLLQHERTNTLTNP